MIRNHPDVDYHLAKSHISKLESDATHWARSRTPRSGPNLFQRLITKLGSNPAPQRTTVGQSPAKVPKLAPLHGALAPLGQVDIDLLSIAQTNALAELAMLLHDARPTNGHQLTRPVCDAPAIVSLRSIGYLTRSSIAPNLSEQQHLHAQRLIAEIVTEASTPRAVTEATTPADLPSWMPAPATAPCTTC